jgi:hypothetical protein
MIYISDGKAGKPQAVYTVKQVATLLERTPRQIYRLIQNGTLISLGKFGHEHVVSKDSVDCLQNNPLQVQPLPKNLKKYFPEYDLKKLNVGKDQVLIVTRLLEDGGLKELRWLLKRYSKKGLAKIVQHYGEQRLSPQACRLWSLFFKIKPLPKRHSWQQEPNPWVLRNVYLA